MRPSRSSRKAVTRTPACLSAPGMAFTRQPFWWKRCWSVAPKGDLAEAKTAIDELAQLRADEGWAIRDVFAAAVERAGGPRSRRRYRPPRLGDSLSRHGGIARLRGARRHGQSRWQRRTRTAPAPRPGAVLTGGLRVFRLHPRPPCSAARHAAFLLTLSRTWAHETSPAGCSSDATRGNRRVRLARRVQ